MKKSLTVAIVVAISLVLGVNSLSALDIPDEQKVMLRPPVENTGGYSGVYYDDQRTLFRSFSYLESWSEANFATGRYTTCKSVLEEPCASSKYLSYETPLSPCSATVIKDCVAGLSLRKSDGNLVEAKLKEVLDDNVATGLSDELKKRYFTPYVGDSTRRIPSSGSPSIWEFPGISHQGGNEFLVIAKLTGQLLDSTANPISKFDVGIQAVSRIMAPVDGQACFYRTQKDCFIRWPMPQENAFKLSIKTYANLVGWFHGRIYEPTIGIENLADGQNLYSIEGRPMSVPILAIWAKNTELPTRLNQMIEKEFEDRGKQFAGTAYFGGDSKDRSLQAVLDERNPAFDDSYFQRYALWVEVAKDKAYAINSVWSFRSMDNYSEYSRCFSGNTIIGIVTTNSNAYIAGPPKFDGSELTYKVASPHYDSKGNVLVGTYDLLLRSDVARCLYGFSQAPVSASISIVYTDGASKTATTVVGEKNNWLYLSAKNFTYSQPTVKIKLQQLKPSEVVKPVEEVKTAPVKAPMKTTISCLKGKTVKKVTAVNPKCPAGYKKK